ncbi:Tat pathway signal protein [Caproiciproducens sp. NJN-50]|uniref:tripartite tricarboxylate transporter permease n=1 Tax=Acutalibacteraceae TaxID=3082771 RepID=UPI000FFE0471|nr:MULTISPECIES: tripartite tricarboxylate transporter permease [Acutalibacteraceae]QAT48744.1 Tat pathway signal protein [Caproiciproducens sp. NJN-50]
MEYILSSFVFLMQPVNLLTILLAAVAGMILGAIPGLSGGLGITLMLPVTFAMEPKLAIAMLTSIWIGGVTGSFIAAVLVGIPGSGSSIPTCFDGYPMTKNGQAVKALGIGIIASFMGTFFSTLIAVWLTQMIANLALKMGPWEYFSLCFFAIMLVVSLSKGNMFRGLASAFIGILLACVGTSPLDGSFRFTFGSSNLIGGLSLVGVMMGLFAVEQVVVAHGKGQKDMPEVDLKHIRGLGVSLQEMKEHVKTIVRGFLIGLWIGFLPGMGSSLAAMVSYGAAKSASKTPEKFGTGYSDGVWASEVANNAGIGGAIIPLIALGIPGDGTAALLLAALMIQGLSPGPLLLTSNPDIAYIIFAATLLAAVLCLFVQFGTIRLFPRLLKLPYHYLFSVILTMCFIGAYTDSNNVFNIYIMVALALLGILAEWGGLPSAPMLLGFILEPMVEQNFRKAVTYSDHGGYAEFFTRPASCLILVLTFVSLLWPVVKAYFQKKRLSKEAKA